MPPVPRRFGTAGGITPTDVAEARKELGRHLAQWRAVAGLRQVDLAKLIRYSRSQIANVEVGRDNTTRVFWRNADAALGARGALLAMSDQVRALVQDFQAQRDHARDQGRQQAGTPSAPPISPVLACPAACGCGQAVVGRWTTREVRALREALRMSLRAFSEHLGVAIAAVSSWEHQTTPTLDEQSVLDQALTAADSHAKARFWLLLDNPEDNLIPGAHDHLAAAHRPTATPIHHANRIRPAS
ncbi:Helix-turn-helix domain-containing protein [Micromonospora aurantiaca]|nr:Helix-turn-helix domain-containing protein [Micromonospora aurantiaca]